MADPTKSEALKVLFSQLVDALEEYRKPVIVAPDAKVFDTLVKQAACPSAAPAPARPKHTDYGFTMDSLSIRTSGPGDVFERAKVIVSANPEGVEIHVIGPRTVDGDVKLSLVPRAAEHLSGLIMRASNLCRSVNGGA